jgi:hypothetical protein
MQVATIYAKGGVTLALEVDWRGALMNFDKIEFLSLVFNPY